jgi:hypothetical protein
MSATRRHVGSIPTVTHSLLFQSHFTFWSNEMDMTFCTAVAMTMHAISFHSQPGFETVTPGVGVTCERQAGYYIGAGVYRNSIARTSAYLTAGIETPRAPLRAGVVAGVATGYDEGPIQPIVGLTLSASLNRTTRVHALLLPLREKAKTSGIVLHVAMSHAF